MYTLSIILNLHREGGLATKTILNLRHILQTAHNWEEVEVIAVLDNHDETTREIIEENSDLFDKIEEVSYRDLGDSRNHGVSVATKNFILFADGDDYCTHNVLQALYNTFYQHYSTIDTSLDDLPEEKHIAVFPQYLIEFPELFHMHYVDSNKNIVQNNRFIHCYHSKIAIHKQLLLKYPILSNQNPYGYEDWDLNNRLLNMGVKYKVSDYKLYYRRGNSQSLLAKQVEQKQIVRNSNIYSLKCITTFNTMEDEKIGSSDSKYHILKKIPQSDGLRILFRDLLFEEDKVFLESYEEIVSYREDITYCSTNSFALKLTVASTIYDNLLEFFYDRDMLYFFPWIGLGGADKVSVEYTKSLADINACVITSLSNGSRIDTIQHPHIDLNSELSGWKELSENEQLHILTKAIVNSGAKLVHIVNSDIALKTIKYYKEVYTEHNIKTIVTLFCPDYDWNNDTYHGYPIVYPELFENADIILSDNNKWYEFFKDLNKNKNFYYKKLASPTKQMTLSYEYKEKNTKKILWASRICNQKLFDVFEEIANTLPEYHFVLYGGQPQEPNNKNILERLLKKDNIEFRGEYQNIDELDLNEFDLYLFTSLFEGIPTIILDMVMNGIPIVTVNVGGISEVLGSDYPLLVEEPRVPAAYITKIKEFYQHKKELVTKMKDIREYIIKEHNEEIFQKEYRNIAEELLNDHR
jgi:glycosyltransferase involved in cell wall biosynthesis